MENKGENSIQTEKMDLKEDIEETRMEIEDIRRTTQFQQDYQV